MKLRAWNHHDTPPTISRSAMPAVSPQASSRSSVSSNRLTRSRTELTDGRIGDQVGAFADLGCPGRVEHDDVGRRARRPAPPRGCSTNTSVRRLIGDHPPRAGRRLDGVDRLDGTDRLDDPARRVPRREMRLEEPRPVVRIGWPRIAHEGTHVVDGADRYRDARGLVVELVVEARPTAIMFGVPATTASVSTVEYWPRCASAARSNRYRSISRTTVRSGRGDSRRPGPGPCSSAS